MGLRLLDLFSGAGGAGAGYHAAGFEVVGVDIKKQSHYPFEFIQCDWTEALRFVGSIDIDVIHASPPCEHYSKMTKKWGRQDTHPDYIPELREELKSIGLPYIIENIVGSPLENPELLCGSMFKLGLPEKGGQLRRHRLFETNFGLKAPEHPKHEGRAIGIYGHTGGSSKRDNVKFWTSQDWKDSMQIDWMNRDELSDAIPPAYTKYIGTELLNTIQNRTPATL